MGFLGDSMEFSYAFAHLAWKFYGVFHTESHGVSMPWSPHGKFHFYFRMEIPWVWNRYMKGSPDYLPTFMLLPSGRQFIVSIVVLVTSLGIYNQLQTVNVKKQTSHHISNITFPFLANVNSFAICCRRPSICHLSVTFVRPTQPVEIWGNVFRH